MIDLRGSYAWVDIAAPYFADKMYQIFSEELIKFMAWVFNELGISQYSSRTITYTNGSI